MDGVFAELPSTVSEDSASDADPGGAGVAAHQREEHVDTAPGRFNATEASNQDDDATVQPATAAPDEAEAAAHVTAPMQSAATVRS